MDINEIYHLIESHLDNEIGCVPENGMKEKRVKLPIPKEYGGGIASGYGYEAAVSKLIERVKEKLAEEVAEENNGQLFSECWEKWIAIKEGQDRSPNTISGYKRVAKNQLLPFFKEKRIDQITADDIQLYFNSIMHLSKSISTQSKAVLCGIFDRADRLGQIQKNPMRFKYERSKKEGKKVVLQDDDLIHVIGQLDDLRKDDIRDYLYGCFLCFTSLRRGEILGLRWEDIDFRKMEISVLHNVIFPDGVNDPIVREPKDGSFGVVHLQSGLYERIRDILPRTGYVLPYSEEERDRPMTRSMFYKMWYRIKKVLDLKGATSHSFRASYATMMNTHCSRIDPKALQGALRHKTPDLAIKVYTKENTSKTRIAEEEYDQWLSERLAK